MQALEHVKEIIQSINGSTEKSFIERQIRIIFSILSKFDHNGHITDSTKTGIISFIHKENCFNDTIHCIFDVMTHKPVGFCIKGMNVAAYGIWDDILTDPHRSMFINDYQDFAFLFYNDEYNNSCINYNTNDHPNIKGIAIPYHGYNVPNKLKIINNIYNDNNNSSKIAICKGKLEFYDLNDNDELRIIFTIKKFYVKIKLTTKLFFQIRKNISDEVFVRRNVNMSKIQIRVKRRCIKKQILIKCCSFCEKIGPLKKCKRCRIACYCDKKCQKHDWNKGGHRLDCRQRRLVIKNNKLDLFRFFDWY